MSNPADCKESLDEVLDRIKKTIEEGTKPVISGAEAESEQSEDGEVLELTNIICDKNSSAEDFACGAIENPGQDLISEHVQNFTRKLNLLTQGHHIVSEKEIHDLFSEMLRPYLKSWLNNNLRDIVKEVLDVEVKRIFSKSGL